MTYFGLIGNIFDCPGYTTMAPAARVSLNKFLRTARKALLAPPAQRPNPLVFVIGNESAGNEKNYMTLPIENCP